MVDNSRKLVRKKSKREAILTEAEKINIRSGKISSKSRSKLYDKLDQRFEALIEDLYLISKSHTLEIWRRMKKFQYRSDLSKLAKIFEDLAGSEFTRIYLDRIRYSKSTNGKKVFWLEASPSESVLDKLWKKKKPYYSDRIFKPEYVLRGLKETKKTRELLMEAYNLSLIPLNAEEGIERKNLQKILESKKKKQSKKKIRCKTCGYVYSAKCSDCRERKHKEFQEIVKEMRPNEYVQFQSIDI